jgi:SPP1 gp7 family putative phage head morphogenesis protein
MATQLAQSAHQANVHAIDMVNSHIPRVFAENANRAGYSIDRTLKADTGFTLVNEEAVRHVMEAGVFDSQLIKEVVPDAPELGPAAIQSLRKREVDYPKDMRWNRQKFNAAITQGILQGESIPNIVKRTRDIYGRNKAAAVRAARTATTNAENAGRMNSFERAQALGIDMELEWLATLDGRTRDSHRALDGERIQLGETFSNGLRWPADPLGSPSEIWNCRCRANGRVVGFDGKRGDWVDERGERWTRLPKGMTYDEWRKAKAFSRDASYKNPSKVQDGFWPQRSVTRAIVDGKDIASTWTPSGKYAYDIMDVIHEQGFDGLPTILDADGFDEVLQETNLIMQRGYGAPSQEVLDAYRDSLYGGDFYVNCAGGHRYGRGLYTSYADATHPTRAMQRTSDRYAASHGASVGYVETMTLDKCAKIIDYDDLTEEWENESIPKWLREGDDGVLAAALGYDAIRTRDGEMVVLNRTKLIIRRPQ